jgi:autophagy-related protein 9
MEIFVSPLNAVFARFITFMAASVLAAFVLLSVWDEDVLNVEHVLTIITVLGGIVAAGKVFIPGKTSHGALFWKVNDFQNFLFHKLDENQVFCPEKTLTAVIAHIHYFPDSWKGQAHTNKVMAELGELFPYTAVYLLQELLSPIVTPFILFFCLRPKAPQIIDFFRNFTVDVIGVGDVCSFAQVRAYF